MSKATQYPWTSRLADTKESARNFAAQSGHTKKGGAAEYDAWHAQRQAARRVREKRYIAPEKPTRTQAYLQRTDARTLVANFADEMDFRGEIRCGRFVEPVMGRTLTKLGIPVRKVLRGFDGGRYGWRPRFALLVLMDEYADFCAYRIATTEQREKARAHRQKAREVAEQQRAALADELGVLPNSRAFAWYLAGDIDENECRRIGEITRRRHEDTNYDTLLATGMPKDDARAIME